MRVIDKDGRVIGMSDKIARALIQMGRVKPYDERAPEAKPKPHSDDKDAVIAELAGYGIVRDRRFSVERLRSELEEARKRYNTRHMTAT